VKKIIECKKDKIRKGEREERREEGIIEVRGARYEVRMFEEGGGRRDDITRDAGHC